MDVLLKTLGESLSGDTGDGVDSLGTEELPKDVESEVMQVLESQLSGEPIKPEPTVQERIETCKEKQNHLESRYRRLQSRINALRAAKLSCHSAEQLQGVVCSCDKRKVKPNSDTVDQPITPAKPVLPNSKTEEKKPLADVVKDEPKEPIPEIAVTNTEGAKGEKVARKPFTYRKRYNKIKTDEVLGQLHGQLRHVQHYMDPDATESSSGGESADEQEPFPTGALLYAPLHERSRYRWLSKRAQLASQWVWLQAQVSDLEYKIRQHTELYRAQRVAKGAVTLGEEVVSWPVHAKVASLPLTSSQDSVPLNCSPATRVYQRQRTGGGEITSNSQTSNTDQSDDEASMTCSRVRPIKRVRRRRLIDTYGLHHVVPKAARLSSVSCSCLHPDQWCVLCLGRRSHTTQVDRSVHSREEGLALLDHSYHTVLSDSRSDTSLNVSLIECVTSRRWMVRHQGERGVGTSQPTHITRLFNINDRVEKKEKKLKKELIGGLLAGGIKRKYIRRKDREGKLLKKRKKQDGERSRPSTPSEMGGEVNIRTVREGMEKIKDKNSLTEQMKRKRKSNYDIDQIVIPYSMAASTRVEKLQYKEIQTPSWKEIDNTPVDENVKLTEEIEEKPATTDESVKAVPDPPNIPHDEEEEFEDISDLTFKLMHAKAEEEERVRWATPLGRVHGGQRGHHGVQGRNRTRRLDSCRSQASSGANTPNPLSPEAIDRVEDIHISTRPSTPEHPDSGETTPLLTTPTVSFTTPSSLPATPVTPAPTSHSITQSPSTIVTQSPGSIMSLATGGPMPTPVIPASLRGRRRTSSQTKSRDRNLSEASQHSQESSRSTSPWTEVEERIIYPWERRAFPLSEDDTKEMECDERPMLPPTDWAQSSPAVCGTVSQSSTTVSAATSRATSRTSSLDEVEATDSADPDWDDNEEGAKGDIDYDPENDPDNKEKTK